MSYRGRSQSFFVFVRNPLREEKAWATLGLIRKKVTADATYNLLQAFLPNDARTIYDFHKALLQHGQHV